MTTLQTLLPILKGVIADVQTMQGLSVADRKTFAVNIINKLIVASNLSQQEQDILQTVLPLVVNDVEEIEAEAKGCFAFLKKKF